MSSDACSPGVVSGEERRSTDELRVLFVIEYAHMTGGMPRSVELLVRYLAQCRVRSGVLLPSGGEAAQAFRSAGADIFVDPRGQGWTLSASRPFASLASLRTFGTLLRRVCREFAPQVIQTSNLMSEVFTAAVAPGLARVFTQRGNEYRGVSRLALTAAIRTATAVVVTSRYQERVALAQLRTDAKKTLLIPNGTDLHLRPAASAELRAAWGAGPENLVIGVVGYPSRGKSQETLIRAAGLMRCDVPQARFVIVGAPGSAGDVQYLEHLRGIVAAGGLVDRVVFAGYVNDPGTIMASLDLLVSTSVREGFGRSVIEAWAYKRPVVAAASGGPATLINDGKDGMLFTPGSATALAAVLADLARAPEKQRALGEAGFERIVREFDARVVAQRYARLYRRIAAGAQIQPECAM